jgi:uncharacterized protein
MTTAGPLLMAVDRAAFVVALGQRLREAGIPVSLTALESCTHALGLSPPTQMLALYWRCRVTLVHRAHDLATFDAVFDAVFRDASRPLEGQATGPAGHAREDDTLLPLTSRTAGTGEDGGLPWHTLPRRVDHEAGSAEGRALPEPLPSSLDALTDTPFEELDEQQLALVGAALATWVRRWPVRQGRRLRVHPSGGPVALRETINASRRTAWEPVELRRTKPVPRPRTVTVVVDVSRSMQPYATAYLHLTHALAGAGRAEAFAFSTSLTRITPALRHRSPARAMELATEQVADRYGGTLLASSLRSLVTSRHGNALRGGILVVASDGWDNDDPELLARVLARIRLRTHRIVWLNPRAAAPGFEPLVGSMAAALPYCDDFTAASTARTLAEALGTILLSSRG